MYLRHFLEGRDFHVFTDHKPLTHALHTRSDRHSPRQARQLDYISQFTSNICHIHGSDNVVADALSRIEMNALLSGQPPVVDFAAMAKAQATDPQIRALQSSPSPHWWCRIFHWLTQITLSSVTSLQAPSALSSHFNGDALCLIHYMAFLIQRFEQHRGSSLPSTCGQVAALMCADGHTLVSSVSVPRSRDHLTLPLSNT